MPIFGANEIYTPNTSQVFGGGIDLIGDNEGWGGRLRGNYGVALAFSQGDQNSTLKNVNFSTRKREFLEDTLFGNTFAFALEASLFGTLMPTSSSGESYISTFGGGPRLVVGSPLGHVFTGLDLIGSIENPLHSQVYAGFRLYFVEATLSFDVNPDSRDLTGTYGIGLHAGF